MHVHLHALGRLLSIVIWRSCRQNRGGTEVLLSEGWCWRWLSWMAHQEVLSKEREFCFTQSYKEQHNISQLIIKEDSYWPRPAWSLHLWKERHSVCFFFGGGENSVKKWTNKQTKETTAFIYWWCSNPVQLALNSKTAADCNNRIATVDH